MTVTRSDEVRLHGKSLRRAWQPGVLPALMARGLLLNEAMWLAEDMGAEFGEPDLVNNLVLTGGKAFLASLLANEDTVGFAYHAIGTGSTTPALADTTLESEVNRKPWTLGPSQNGASVEASAFYLGSECNYVLEEAGAFCGDSASATPGSGQMLSRYLQVKDNSGDSPLDLTYEYVFTFI